MLIKIIITIDNYWKIENWKWEIMTHIAFSENDNNQLKILETWSIGKISRNIFII